MVAAAQVERLDFEGMGEAELRQWVEANPERVNDRNEGGRTPLYETACGIKSLPLTVWLLDEKGVDVNGTTFDGFTTLHATPSLGILTALLDRGADLTLLSHAGWTPLMWQACYGTVESVAHLLQDPRVQATVNV